MTPNDNPADIKRTSINDDAIPYRTREPLTPRQKQILIICSIVLVAAIVGIAILIWRSRKTGEAETKEEPVVSVKVTSPDGVTETKATGIPVSAGLFRNALDNVKNPMRTWFFS